FQAEDGIRYLIVTGVQTCALPICWLAAVVAAGVGALHFANAAESPPANTNAPSVALDTLVADVLEHNPELNFYRAEIAAAKGEQIGRASCRGRVERAVGVEVDKSE